MGKMDWGLRVVPALLSALWWCSVHVLSQEAALILYLVPALYRRPCYCTDIWRSVLYSTLALHVTRICQVLYILTTCNPFVLFAFWGHLMPLHFCPWCQWTTTPLWLNFSSQQLSSLTPSSPACRRMTSVLMQAEVCCAVAFGFLSQWASDEDYLTFK